MYTLAAVALAGVTAIVVRAYRLETASFYEQRHAVPWPADRHPLEGLETVSLRGRAGELLAAWYVPSRNRAAVVLCHGSGSDRSALLDEAELLSTAGFGVLMLDGPGHGESEGEVRWSVSEHDALRAALDWLSQRADVDANKLGAYGFSLGGYLVANYAAVDARVRAVALAGCPTDASEQTRWEYRRYGLLSQAGAFLALLRVGFPLDGPRPLDSVAKIAPRPLLLVTGHDDEVVPSWMVEQLFRAAAQPKYLLALAGVGHGSYAESAEFTRALPEFFARSLL